MTMRPLASSVIASMRGGAPVIWCHCVPSHRSSVPVWLSAPAHTSPVLATYAATTGVGGCSEATEVPFHSAHVVCTELIGKEPLATTSPLGRTPTLWALANGSKPGMPCHCVPSQSCSGESTVGLKNWPPTTISPLGRRASAYALPCAAGPAPS